MHENELFLQIFDGVDWLTMAGGYSDFADAISAYERKIGCGEVVRLIHRPQNYFIVASPENGFFKSSATVSEFDHTTAGNKCRKGNKMYIQRHVPKIVSVIEIAEVL